MQELVLSITNRDNWIVCQLGHIQAKGRAKNFLSGVETAPEPLSDYYANTQGEWGYQMIRCAGDATVLKVTSSATVWSKDVNDLNFLDQSSLQIFRI